MRQWRVTATMVLGCLLVAGNVAGASDGEPTDPFIRREEVVALVLSQDPRFASLPDYDRLEMRASSLFEWDRVLGASYYRVLPNVGSVAPHVYDLSPLASWLVEVALVDGCTDTSEQEDAARNTWPPPDPCAWRHSWLYRVEPDDSVTLLFEEGDPYPMPAG